MAIFTGAGVAIITPFHADGSINYEKLEEGMNRFCNYLGAQQVNKDDWNNMVLNR